MPAFRYLNLNSCHFCAFWTQISPTRRFDNPFHIIGIQNAGQKMLWRQKHNIVFIITEFNIVFLFFFCVTSKNLAHTNESAPNLPNVFSKKLSNPRHFGSRLSFKEHGFSGSCDVTSRTRQHYRHLTCFE